MRWEHSPVPWERAEHCCKHKSSARLSPREQENVPTSPQLPSLPHAIEQHLCSQA